MKAYLEYRDGKSAKFWEVVVEGSSYTVRFGRIGTNGQSKTKTLESAEAAREAAGALIAQKQKKGYAAAGEEPAPATAPLRELAGAVFYAAGDGVTANAVLAEMREDGKTSRKDGRKIEGLGSNGLVGVAIHPARDGWMAVVDGADGCQGIGAGEWSRAALIANHLGTDAIWYRAFSDDLAVAVRFRRGGSFFDVVPGTRAEILEWLEAQGVRAADAVPPKDAGKDATVAAIQYSKGTYRVGPDASDAARLVAIRDALRAGDAGALRALCDGDPIEKLPLALGVIRAAEGDAHERAIVGLARAVLAEPMRPRTKPKEMTLDEEVLRRAAAFADEETFAACVERLDAIERDAEKQSDWAMPGGLWLLAYACAQRDPKRAFECYRRLAMRAQPHWENVNMALAMLAQSTAPGSAVDGPAAELIRTSEGLLKEYGADARDALLYNLACVYARAGRVGDALSALRRCRKIRKQNPSPETDEDLEVLWTNPEFLELLGAAAPAPSADDEEEDEDDEEEDDEDDEESDYRPPRDRAVPRQRIRFRKGGDPKALDSRIGGLPNASDGVEWPDGYNRPMRFVLQLVGTAAGGEVDLGDVSVISVFADLDGDYYEASCQKVLLSRGRCDAVLEPPAGVETDAVRLLTLEPGHDDRILLDIDWLEEGEPQYDEWEAARKHAFDDKLWGIPVGANVDPNQRDAQGRPMKCLLQLVTYDDWFLWYLFVSEDFSEARLQVVRG